MPVEPDERRMDREAYVCTRESERRGRRGWHGRTKNRTPRCLERGPREIVGFFVFHFHCACTRGFFSPFPFSLSSPDSR